jgi:REP element-mobilizing transposase RayT
VPRRLRIQFAGALYHVTSRGNDRKPIFTSDVDRYGFLGLLARVVAQNGWLCHAFCLMLNHFHLVLETPEPNLSRGMRILNGRYAQRFNDLHGTSGHLFGERHKAILVHKETHLLELARYVVLNPVRAGICRDPEQWPWSSYAATVGHAPCPSFLTTDWLEDGRVEALGQRLQDLELKLRLLLEQGPEGAVGDHERPQGRLRDDRRRPRRVGDQRDLAEEVAGAHRADRPLALEHVRHAVEQDEELASPLALADELLALGQVDLVGDVGDRLELLPRAVREERRAPDQVDLRVAVQDSHCQAPVGLTGTPSGADSGSPAAASCGRPVIDQSFTLDCRPRMSNSST